MQTTLDMKQLIEGFNKYIDQVSRQEQLAEHRGVPMKDKGIKGQNIDRKRKEASAERAKEKDRVKKMTQPAGHSELMSLAHGVTEEDKAKKPNCGRGQARHDKDGKWSSKANNTSWTLNHYEPNSGKCKSGKMKTSPGSNQIRITKHPCGAKKTGPNGGEGKHPYRCKDGSKAWESLIVEEDVDGIEWVRLEDIKRFLSQFENHQDNQDTDILDTNSTLTEEGQVEDPGQYCNGRGFYKVAQILTFINNAVDASKGELGKK
jgi:hypothetical protein